MSSPAEISMCTHEDYNQILDELQEFWGARDTRHLHHPFLVHEFGNSAFVIRNGAQVVAYLFGFLSQTEPVGYVHTVAVRTPARRPRGRAFRPLRGVRPAAWLQARQGDNHAGKSGVHRIPQKPGHGAPRRRQYRRNSGASRLCRLWRAPRGFFGNRSRGTPHQQRRIGRPSLGLDRAGSDPGRCRPRGGIPPTAARHFGRATR
jgi:hypothetical protein